MKVLISGGGGLLATNLILKYKDKYEIETLVRNKSLNIDDIKSHTLSLEDLNATTLKVKEIAPDIIIHTAGLTNVEVCENNYYLAHLSNVLGSKNLAQAAKESNVKFVHISTDHFCDSENELTNEEQIELPKNNYGLTKLSAEKVVLDSCPDAIIARTNFFGWGHKHRSSFSDMIISSLREGKEVNLFTDTHYTPILIDNLCKSIFKLIEINENGVFNVIGGDRVSKYDFGIKLADAFLLDKSLIKRAKLTEANLVNRPLDMSLSNQKLVTTLGQDFDFNLDESISLLRSEETSGYKEIMLNSVEHRGNPNIIAYGKQNIEETDISAVVSTLTSNYLTQGPKVIEFEEAVAKYTNSKFAVAVSNLTCGLHAAVMSLDIKEGDYVITSPISFVASSNAAIYCGATPLFADIDPDTLNISPSSIEELFEEYGNKIKAVIPVHFAGSPCDLERIKMITDSYGAQIIEDAAHGLGGSYRNGEKIGSCHNSSITGFSFHPVKNITTGEGGVLTTNSEDIYHELLRIRSHGITKGNDSFKFKDEAFTEGVQNPWYYEMQRVGFNFRITDIQCSLGISQLHKIDRLHSRRVEIGEIYDRELLSCKNIKLLQTDTRKISGNHLYTICVDFDAIGMSRNEVYAKFREQGILLHVHYIPIIMQPYYKDNYATKNEDYPNSVNYYRGAVTLPFYPDLKDQDIYRVINIFKEIVG